MHHLNAEGHCRALYVNIEEAQAARNDVQRAELGMVQPWPVQRACI